MGARRVAWLTLVGAMIALAYYSRAATGDPPDDALYDYGTAAGGVIWYAVTLLLVLWITRGPAQRDLLGLRRPVSTGRAVGLAIAVIVAIYVLSAAIEPLLHASEEQGLTPDRWEPDRAGGYAANFVVVAVIAPIVEELMFRGAGYSLFAPFGSIAAVVGVGVLFGLVHGLVAGLVILSIFGIGLGWLRSRTASVYPGIAVHALFNAIALVVAVTI